VDRPLSFVACIAGASSLLGRAARLLGLRLLVAGRLLRGLKLLHGLLQACYRAFERHNLGGGLVQLMSRLERILDHEPLQKVYVALKAPCSLVQSRGFRAVLYPRDILRPSDIDSDDDRLKPSSAILTMRAPLCSVSRDNAREPSC
jgi:hypothetical protein